MNIKHVSVAVLAFLGLALVGCSAETGPSEDTNQDGVVDESDSDHAEGEGEAEITESSSDALQGGCTQARITYEKNACVYVCGNAGWKFSRGIQGCYPGRRSICACSNVSGRRTTIAG